MVTRSLAALLAIAALGACQGKERERADRSEPSARPVAADDAAAAAPSPDAGAPSGFGSAAGSASGSGAGSGSAAPAAAPGDTEAQPDPGRQIAELGAIPAWQAVIDRAQLLARRGQKGIVYGRIGPVILMPGPAPDPADGGVPIDAGMVASPYVWLVDDTEGHGSLGIRLALGALQAKEGDRIAARGAWELDEGRRWYWKAEALQPLAPPAAPANAPPDPPAAVPGHVPVAGGFPPGVRPIKQAKDHDAVYFQLVGPTPAGDGDGWLVGEQLYGAPIALLILPGERGSYGGQDLRTTDERWQLKRQTIYWVRIGKIRPQGPGKPFLAYARTAPVRVQ